MQPVWPGLSAFEQLARFWGELRSSGVYQLNVSQWTRFNKYLAAWSLSRHARASGAILDNSPLMDTLCHALSLPGVDSALGN
jgi:NTE family protein